MGYPDKLLADATYNTNECTKVSSCILCVSSQAQRQLANSLGCLLPPTAFSRGFFGGRIPALCVPDGVAGPLVWRRPRRRGVSRSLSTTASPRSANAFLPCRRFGDLACRMSCADGREHANAFLPCRRFGDLACRMSCAHAQGTYFCVLPSGTRSPTSVSPGSVGRPAHAAFVRACTGGRELKTYDRFDTPDKCMPPRFH